MIDIDSYKLLFINNKYKVIYLWLLFTVFIIISLLIIIKSTDFNCYYQNKGIGTKEGYLKTVIEVDQLNNLIDKNHIIIDDKSYSYNIVAIDQHINQVQDKLFQEVTININDKDLLDNSYVSFKILIQNIKFFDYIKNKIGGKI